MDKPHPSVLNWVVFKCQTEGQDLIAKSVFPYKNLMFQVSCYQNKTTHIRKKGKNVSHAHPTCLNCDDLLYSSWAKRADRNCKILVSLQEIKNMFLSVVLFKENWKY